MGTRAFLSLFHGPSSSGTMFNVSHIIPITCTWTYLSKPTTKTQNGSRSKSKSPPWLHLPIVEEIPDLAPKEKKQQQTNKNKQKKQYSSEWRSQGESKDKTIQTGGNILKDVEARKCRIIPGISTPQ